MPKQTFFNLPDEKQERILECAVDEFASRGYKMSSISHIVEAAGIAKGSFYQYFDDKGDLFAHIVKTMIGDRKLGVYEREKIRLKEMNLSEYLRIVFHGQLREFEQNPRLYKIGLDLMGLVGDPVYERIYAEYGDIYNVFFLPYIQHEILEGEIDSRVNPQLLSFMLMSLGQYLVFLLSGGASPDKTMLDKLADDLDFILTNGIYTSLGKRGM